MPTNLLILPLLAGFCFVHFCLRFRFRAQRQDGYRLLLESGVAGAAFLAISRIGIAVAKLSGVGMRTKALWESFTPIPYLGTAVGSVCVAVLAAWAFNYRVTSGFRDFFRRLWRCQRKMRFVLRVFRRVQLRNLEKARNYEIVTHGSSLTRLLHYADRQTELVSVTLANGKWYVGFVAEAINLDPQEAYFRILPIISGYRRRETLEPTRTVYYPTVYEKPEIDSGDFVITIPIREVLIASLFDARVYEDHFAGHRPLWVPGS
jgi:Family of unknown function (DUF6338)